MWYHSTALARPWQVPATCIFPHRDSSEHFQAHHYLWRNSSWLGPYALCHLTPRLLYPGHTCPAQPLGVYSHRPQCEWHPGVVQYTTCTTWWDGPSCTQRQSGNSENLLQAFDWVGGWVGSTLILLFSSNTAVKTQTNETPKRIWVSVFPITLNMHSSPTWVPICIILSSTEIGPSPWGASCLVSLVTLG